MTVARVKHNSSRSEIKMTELEKRSPGSSDPRARQGANNSSRSEIEMGRHGKSSSLLRPARHPGGRAVVGGYSGLGQFDQLEDGFLVGLGDLGREIAEPPGAPGTPTITISV